jgi:hypothetical protein
MLSKIKNIIIFLVIGGVLVGGYVLFSKTKSANEPSLVGSSGTLVDAEGSLKEQDSAIAKELLGVLLNVKNISLNDSIFDEQAFISLRDSTILLVPDGNEGRPNPFAPIGTDISLGNTIPATPVIVSTPTPTTTTPPTSTTSTTPTTPVTPTPNPTTPVGIPAN